MSLLKIKNLSVISLVLVNLVPLAGVLFWKWQLFSILFLYWLESAIVGFYTVLRMLKAEGKGPSNFEINDRPAEEYSRAFVIGFFIMHYGIFMAVHRMFLFAFFGPARMSHKEIAIAFLFLLLSHGISYVFNFLGKQEYKRLSLGQLMMQPYARIFVMHFTVLLGGFAIKSLGAPPVALVVMILGKTTIDLCAHLREHQKAEAPLVQGG
jgi:hypothetical protein